MDRRKAKHWKTAERAVLTIERVSPWVADVWGHRDANDLLKEVERARGRVVECVRGAYLLGTTLLAKRAGHEVRQGQGSTIVTIQVPVGPRRLWCHIIRRYAVHRLKAIDSQRPSNCCESFNLQLPVARIASRW